MLSNSLQAAILRAVLGSARKYCRFLVRAFRDLFDRDAESLRGQVVDVPEFNCNPIAGVVHRNCIAVDVVTFLVAALYQDGYLALGKMRGQFSHYVNLNGRILVVGPGVCGPPVIFQEVVHSI